LQEVFDMRNDDIFRAASGLAAGVGMQADTCGALLGASLMLGLKYGRRREEIDKIEALDESGIPVARLYKWFQTEFGSATCRVIRTRFGGGAFYDFFIPWEREMCEKIGMFEKCSDLVGRAAARTAEMLWDAIEAEKKAEPRSKSDGKRAGRRH
jgi:hypothetical protein